MWSCVVFGFEVAYASSFTSNRSSKKSGYSRHFSINAMVRKGRSGMQSTVEAPFSGVNGRRRGCPVLAGASRRRHHYLLQFDSRERWKNPSLHICSNAHEYAIETICDLIERVGRIRFVETSRSHLSHRPQVAETALN